MHSRLHIIVQIYNKNVFLKGLSSALATVCDYDRNADMLPVSCSSIRNVRYAFGPDSEPWKLNGLVSKLKGPASSGFAARLTQYTSVESLLTDLKTQFRGREGANSLKKKLHTNVQEPNESAANFGLRIQSLNNSIVNTIDQHPSILDHHRKILKEIDIKDAREQFLCGLKPKL